MKIVAKLLLIGVLALAAGLQLKAAQKGTLFSRAFACCAKNKAEKEKALPEQSSLLLDRQASAAHDAAGALLDRLPAVLSRIVLEYAQEDASCTIDLTEFLKNVGTRKGYKEDVEFLISRMQLLNNGLINVFVYATQPAAKHALDSVQCTISGKVLCSDYASKKINDQKRPAILPSLAFDSGGCIYEAKAVKPVVFTISCSDMARVGEALSQHHLTEAKMKSHKGTALVAQ